MLVESERSLGRGRLETAGADHAAVDEERQQVAEERPDDVAHQDRSGKDVVEDVGSVGVLLRGLLALNGQVGVLLLLEEHDRGARADSPDGYAGKDPPSGSFSVSWQS